MLMWGGGWHICPGLHLVCLLAVVPQFILGGWLLFLVCMPVSIIATSEVSTAAAISAPPSHPALATWEAWMRLGNRGALHAQPQLMFLLKEGVKKSSQIFCKLEGSPKLAGKSIFCLHGPCLQTGTVLRIDILNTSREDPD
uniref:Uncharacterized protein n=1 Tax=Sphaerodactylus townsendi TaxID=933632 RepID=A0ACB8G3C5_9SAUR